MSLFADYVRAAWKLCAIPKGSKGPDYSRWNEQPIDAVGGIDGAGLLHSLSGTCALDIDHLPSATAWLAERGVDLEVLLSASDAVRIESGRPNRAKLLYRLSKPLPTLKPKGSGLELRCATQDGKSVQDVLPPSIHPQTKKPYEWRYGDELTGHWSVLPPIPASLLAAWRELAPKRTAPAAATVPSTALPELRKLIAKRDPNAAYDEWLKTGMIIHHESAGTAEGFLLWCDWSRKVTRIPYPGDALLKTHWLSFSSGVGKRVATAGSLRAEDVATAEDFEDEPTEPAAAIEDKVAQAKAARASAIALLEKRLIYIAQLDRYMDAEKRDVLATDHAIQHRFTAQMPQRGTARADPVKILRESRNREIVDAIAFHPGADGIFESNGERYANTYRPLPLELLEPTAQERDCIEWLFAKIEDKTFREWLLKFLAHMIQKPGVKIRSCPLIWSAITGNGKSTMLSTVPRELVGARYHREVDYTAVEEKFNGFVRDTWVLSLKEFKAGTKAERVAIAQRLKPWITDDFIPVREMRTDTYNIPNRFVMTATSNEPDAAPIDIDDRRWGVYELKTAPITPAEVADVVVGFFNGPRARGVLTSYFRGISLTGFNPAMRPPETEARAEMIEASLSAQEEALRDMWEQQSNPFERDCFQTTEIQDALRRRGVFVPSTHYLGRWLRARGAEQRQMRDTAGRRYRIWITRNAESRWRHAQPAEVLTYMDGVDALLV